MKYSPNGVHWLCGHIAFLMKNENWQLLPSTSHMNKSHEQTPLLVRLSYLGKLNTKKYKNNFQ